MDNNILQSNDEFCKWIQVDEDSEDWESSCGESFWLEDHNPFEGGMKYCCYCGKKLVHVSWIANEEVDNNG